MVNIQKKVDRDTVGTEKIGQQLSDLTPEAEVPTATKAAASRAKKTRKPKVSKATAWDIHETLDEREAEPAAEKPAKEKQMKKFAKKLSERIKKRLAVK